ncbi:YecA family protein [Marinimicrobium agarilyticum]|uniref:YecA family protein n=1 Tax=Marinimicrobium agarilyticum TaxID=306546 RepID=UPI0004804ED1|nr:SEC-C metal-binding domain-containing protein [Marinimicrobium agarilyticum]
MSKTGRNDPCPCGSGRKYKKCCLLNAPAPVSDLARQRLRKTEATLVEPLLRHAESAYGAEFMMEAWVDFKVGFDWPLSEDTAEVETIFLPWMLYNWIPDNAELPEAEHWPEETIAEHYLRHGSRRADLYTQRFIEAATAEPFSFFVVTDATPSHSITLRDLLLNREVTVLEQMASESVRLGHILFTRIVSVDNATVMLGTAPVIIPGGYSGPILQERDRFVKMFGALDTQALHEVAPELRELYGELRNMLLNPAPPELTNTDGDPLTFITLRYELDCSPEQAVQALKTLNIQNGGSEEEVLAEAEYDGSGALIRASFPWLRRGNATDPHLKKTVMARIIIEGSRLEVEVNSEARATSIKRRIGQRLNGGRARFVGEVEGSFDDLEASENAPSTAPSQDELMQAPEVQEAIANMARAHWEQWLDDPLPALDDKTPRQASRTASGRERLELLLLEFEGKESGTPFDPDVDVLRERLGMPS